MKAWLHDTSISLFQQLKMMILLSKFSFIIKRKVKFQNKRGNSSKNAKKFNKFQEKQLKHGVSDKFSVILTLNGLEPKF